MKRYFTYFLLFFPFSLFSQIIPRDISGLSLWLSTDSGIVANGVTGFEWKDRSGESNHAYQDIAVNKPSLVDSIDQLNNFPVVRFDGANDFMKIDSTVKAGTAFILSNYAGGGVVFPAFKGLLTRQSGVQPVYLLVLQSGANIFYAGGGDSYFHTPNYYKNSVQTQDYLPFIDYKLTTAFASSVPDSSTLIIGNNPYDGGNCFWNGDIAEIILYNRILSALEIQQVEQYLYDKYAPPVNLGPDVLYGFCFSDTLDAGNLYVDYLWSNGSTASFIPVTTSGQYSVTVTDIFGFQSSDVINIVITNINEINDTTICYGSSIKWDTQLNKAGYDFLWQDGSTDSVFTITQAGQYYVKVTDTLGAGCVRYSDTINITVNNFSQVASLGPDTILCSGNPIFLVQGAAQATSYLWSTGATTSSIAISTTNDYSVTVANSLGCIKKDTIHVTISGTAPTVNFNASITCDGDSMHFTDMTIPSTGIASWLWNFDDGNNSSSQNPAHLYADSGNYQVTLTVMTSAGCSQTFSKNIKIFPLPKANFNNSVASIGGNTQFTDISNAYGYAINSWSWNFDDPVSGLNDTSTFQNPIHQFAQNGYRNVKLVVQTQQGCMDSVVKSVLVYVITPSSISGLSVWYSGDNVTLSSGKVSQWNDLSININNASQSDIAKQPLFVNNVSILNNQPVVRFDGTNDFMQFSPLNIRTAFFVVKHVTGNTDYNTLLGNSFSYNWHGGSGAQLFNNYPETSNIINGQGFVNGIAVAPLSMVKPIQYSILGLITSANHPAEHITGDFANNPNPYWNGDYAEIIIYSDSLTSIQRQQVEQYLRDKYAPPINLGADIAVNYGFCPVKLNAHKDWFTSYQWSTGSTIDSISINKEGSYSTSVVNIFGYTSSDTVNVTYPGNFSPFPDTTICYGTSIKWNTQLNKTGYSFLWQDGSTDSVFTITQAGQYYVRVTDTIGGGCEFYSDTLNILVDNFSQVASLGPDTTLCSGNSISLIQGAAQATSYLWSTGETTTSIAITATGTYSVVVTSVNGCIAKDTMNVVIKGIAPIADFFADTVCYGDTTFFSDLSTVPSPDGISVWSWNFGDGENSFLQNPFHSYTASGTYATILSVVSDSGCSATIQKPVIVNSRPSAGFSTSLACSGNSTQFTNLSSLSSVSWNWNFGDPSSGSNDTSSQKNPTHIYASAGTYSVQLTAISASGCQGMLLSSVTVLQSPSAAFTSTSVCKGNNTAFTDASTGGVTNWLWNFGDASASSIFKNPVHQYISAGTYSVVLLVTAANGCVNRDTNTVNVYYLPQVGFTTPVACMNSPLQFTDTSSAQGSTINSWNWQFGTMGSSALQNPLNTFTSTGTHSVTLSVISAQGCLAASTHTVSVKPSPVSNFSFSPAYGAPPLAVNFSNSSSGGLNYQWNFGDGGQSALQNPQYIYQDTGLFSIQLTTQNSFGCTHSSIQDIYVISPVLDIAVSVVSATKSSNTVQVSTVLYNAGTLDVTLVELSAYFDNGTPIHEFYIDTVKSHSYANYSFNSSFELVNDQQSIICIEAKKINGRKDDVASNDRKCTSITDEFVLLDPFPNPTVAEIYFLFVTPDVSHVQAQIFDARGRLVETLLDGEAPKGLNQINYNTINLNKGLYALKLVCKGKSSTRMFMKE